MKKRGRISKKGLSGVITAVLMIALVMTAVIIIWVVINNTIKAQLKSTESCFGNYNKVVIDRIYTCYDEANSIFEFSLGVGDIDINSIVVFVSAGGGTSSFTLTNTAQTIDNLANYGSTGFGTDSIQLPGKNSGLTYRTDITTVKPDLIKISPVIDGQQCDVSDSISDIELCF